MPATSAAVLSGSSASAAPKVAKCPAAANDETAAGHAAAACHGRVEVLADRDEKTQVFPGTTPLSDTDSDVDFGFSFPFYGETYTTASVQGGGVYVRNTWDPAPDEIQTGGDIEFNVGGFDFDDAQFQMLTTTVGTAPNRQFVVEWRDIAFTDHPGVRLTWEMIFSEDGTVKMVFPDPPPPGTFDAPIRSWFYALGISLIDYSEDGNGFLTGQSLVFRPPAAS